MTNRARKVISDNVDLLDPEEKRLVLVWAQKSELIVKDETLTKSQKALALVKNTPSKPALLLLKKLTKTLKVKFWEGQSWARRLGIAGFVIGAGTLGGKAAGIASMGFGVSISLWLLTGVGATFLGVLIDELKKEIGG